MLTMQFINLFKRKESKITIFPKANILNNIFCIAKVIQCDNS